MVLLHITFPSSDDFQTNFQNATVVVYKLLKIIDILCATYHPSVILSFPRFYLYFFSPTDVLFDQETKNVRKNGVLRISKGIFELTVGLSGAWLIRHFIIPLSPKPGEIVGFYLPIFASYFLLRGVVEGFINGMMMILYGDGIIVEYSFRNLLVEGTSLSKFWSGWNVGIHIILKRCVYLPIKKKISSNVAIGSVFLVSALLHEYMVYLRIGRFSGSQIAFFGLNAIGFFVERLLMFDEVPVLNRLVALGFMLLTLPIFFADVGVK